jgi:hypothetical protein
MPIVAVDGTDVSYHLIAFDAQGSERADDPGGRMSEVIEQALTPEVTDVFLFSHGWRGDLPASNQQYQRWVKAMYNCTADRQRIREVRPGFRSLLIGLHWPSEPFGEEDFQDVNFDVAGSGQLDVNAALARWTDRLGVDGAGVAALTTILQAAADDPVPPQLPADVRNAYLTLNNSLGLGADGVGAGPDADRKSFDPDVAYASALEDEVDFGGGFSFGDILTPLKQLSFWTMKARARTVGEGGGHGFLQRLLEAPGRDHVRFHLVGHSFGCIVITGMAAGPAAGPGPVRPVSSMSLIQGAVSLWSYCSDIPSEHGTPGYFHAFSGRPDVIGPLITTRSVHDKAVGFWYPKAAGMSGEVDFAPDFPVYGGIGTFGMQGPGLALNDVDMGDETTSYAFEPQKVYNLMADNTIVGGDFFSGAHSQIANPAVAHSVWEAVTAAP